MRSRADCGIARSRRRPPWGAIAITVAIMVGLSDPAAAQTIDDQRFRLIFRGDPAQVPGMVVAQGPITGVGAVHVTGGSATSFTVRYDLPDGNLFLTVSPTSQNFEPNPTSCSARITSTATVLITGGTGSFSGASGTGSATSRARVMWPRERGECLIFQGPPIRGIELVKVTVDMVLPD